MVSKARYPIASSPFQRRERSSHSSSESRVSRAQVPENASGESARARNRTALNSSAVSGVMAFRRIMGGRQSHYRPPSLPCSIIPLVPVFSFFAQQDNRIHRQGSLGRDPRRQ